MTANQSKVENLCIALCHSHGKDPFELTKLETTEDGAERWGCRWQIYEQTVKDFLVLLTCAEDWT